MEDVEGGWDGGRGRGMRWRTWKGDGMEDVEGGWDGGRGRGMGWRTWEGDEMEDVEGGWDGGRGRGMGWKPLAMKPILATHNQKADVVRLCVN